MAMKYAMFTAADGSNWLVNQSSSSVNNGLALVHLTVNQIQHVE